MLHSSDRARYGHPCWLGAIVRKCEQVFVVGARPAGWFVSCVVTLCCQFSVAIGVDKKSTPEHVSASSGYLSTDVRR